MCIRDSPWHDPLVTKTLKEARYITDADKRVKKYEEMCIRDRSTILKMITGVTYPTNGDIIVNGRVSALLELTAGFDPEFTGRENIYFRGRLLGMEEKEIEELEPSIIEFADVYKRQQ